MYSSGAWCAASLAILLVGCATIPDGSVSMTVDKIARIEANYRALVAEIMRLRFEKVPLCSEVRR